MSNKKLIKSDAEHLCKELKIWSNIPYDINSDIYSSLEFYVDPNFEAEDGREGELNMESLDKDHSNFIDEYVLENIEMAKHYLQQAAMRFHNAHKIVKMKIDKSQEAS
jgi:hypothetical protein